MSERGRRRPAPQCPLRPGEPCTLCQLDVTGPEDCGLVYLVMSDPDLRAQLYANRRLRHDSNPAGESARRADPGERVIT